MIPKISPSHHGSRALRSHAGGKELAHGQGQASALKANSRDRRERQLSTIRHRIFSTTSGLSRSACTRWDMPGGRMKRRDYDTHIAQHERPFVAEDPFISVDHRRKLLNRFIVATYLIEMFREHIQAVQALSRHSSEHATTGKSISATCTILWNRKAVAVKSFIDVRSRKITNRRQPAEHRQKSVHVVPKRGNPG